MKKTLYIFILISTVFLLLTGCNFDTMYYKGTSNTVTFNYRVPDGNIIIYVEAKNDASPASFTLTSIHNEEKVTWSGQENDFIGDYKISWAYIDQNGSKTVKGISYKEYTSLKEISCYNDY
ncbi:MAG: hypothetical protein K5866_01585 [Treponema sp.]|nr:hypothetical protein [Treponema sp.]